MVKNKLATLYIVLFLLCTIAPFVHAEDALELTEVRIFVDGTRATNIDEEGGDTVDDDVYPGSTIKVKLTIENTYSDNDDDDIEIEDIKIEGQIIDVDLGADVDDEVDEFDLDPEEEEEVTLTFDIPDEVYADTYRLEFKIEGEADDGTEFEIERDYYVKVQKREHDVRIVDVVLKDKVVQCGEETTITVVTQNFGREDENRARIKVENDQIPLTYASMFYLDSKVSADNNKYTKTYPVQIPADFEPGNYDLQVIAHYDKTIQTDSSLAVLEVQCSDEVVEVAPQPSESNPNAPSEDSAPQQGSTSVPSQPAQGTTQAPVQQAPAATTQPNQVEEAEVVTESDDEGFLEKYKWIILIALLNLVILLVGVGLIVRMNQPRKPAQPKAQHAKPVQNHFLDTLHKEEKKPKAAPVAQNTQPVTKPAAKSETQPESKSDKPFTFSYYDLK